MSIIRSLLRDMTEPIEVIVKQTENGLHNAHTLDRFKHAVSPTYTLEDDRKRVDDYSEQHRAAIAFQVAHELLLDIADEIDSAWNKPDTAEMEAGNEA